MKKPFYHLQQPRELIRQFTPNWFTMVMGTGVVSLILPEFASGSTELLWLAQTLWQINIVFFSIFSVLYALRWIIYPKEAQQIFSHPSMALFLGAIPMALATLLNGFLKYGIDLYGDIAIQIAHSLWYVDIFLAVTIGIVVPFCMFSRQEHHLHNMTAMWLLPIVACEVAATSGGLLIQHLPNNAESLGILIASYVLWGMSVLPAFAVLSILMLRLALHQLPSRELAMSSWLALGPIGTGALALLVLGAAGQPMMEHFQLHTLGMFLKYAGWLTSVILLGFGVWWFAIAILTSLSHAKQLAFNLGWWALTFPLGVFTLAVLQLAAQTELHAIHSIGLGLAALLCTLWCIVIGKTGVGIYRGDLFFSPCLKSYLEQQAHFARQP
ncbi:TDT family transporter [Acinetobacter rudis]|uniref:TDT family transporter n=1 Tax=Acinetobacter rudis TaxID=632955 RepID=UPI003341636B